MQNGILLLNKRIGSSSARELVPVKRAFTRHKVGHTGTLDPFATGLLVILVGQATKLSRFFLRLDKRYTGVIRFGAETDTLDTEGTVIREAPLPSGPDVLACIPRFLGTTDQIPPAYSALNVGGQRSYSLARAGKAVELPPRSITIHSLTMQPRQNDPSRWDFSVYCGSGTYVRALARDIGAATNSAAHLEQLVRTSVGPFLLEEATDTDGITSTAEPVNLLIPVVTAVQRLGMIALLAVDSTQARLLRNGIEPERIPFDPTVFNTLTGKWVLCVEHTPGIGDSREEPVALLEKNDGGVLRFAAVFPQDSAV